LQALDENSTQIIKELAEILNVDKSTFLIVYTQWKTFRKKANGFYVNCLNWLFKII